jgi:hypothetical protein
MKVKLLVVLVIAAAIAATGGSWKWSMPSHVSPDEPSYVSPDESGQYNITGWTWGD